MKKYLIILSLFFFTTLIYAQVDNQKGSQHLKVGAHFFGNDNNLKATYNYGINNMFSVGTGIYAFHDSYAFIKGDFHLGSIVNLPDNLAVFGGVELGVIGIDFLNFDLQLGVAYAISQHIDLYIEFGRTGTVGVSFAF